MTDEQDKRSSPKKVPEQTPSQPSKATRRMTAHSKLLYHINPLGMRVLIKIPKEQNVTDGGLYLPEGSKEAMLESMIGEVIAVASAEDDKTTEETNVSGIPLGVKVLIPKKAGIKVPWDDNLRIVDTKDVLAIVETIEIS